MSNKEELEKLKKIYAENKGINSIEEARALIKEEERHKFVTECFLEWVVREMFEEEYKDYMKRWNEEEKYNLMMFIKEQGIPCKIKPRKLEWEE